MGFNSSAAHSSTDSEIGPGRHLMDGALRMILAEALMPITGIVTAAYLTRALGPADYGRLTVSATVFAFLEFVILISFSRAAVRFSADPEHWKPAGIRILQVHLVVGALLGLLLYVVSPWASRILGDESLSRYMRLFALVLPLAIAAGAHRNILTGRGEYRWHAICRVAYIGSRMVLMILFVQLGWSVTGAILGMMGASLIELMLSRLRVSPSIWGKSDTSVMLLFGYAAPLALRALCLRLIRSDLLFLQALGGDPADAGIYGAAQNLSTVPALLGIGISGLLLSTLVRVKTAGDEDGGIRISRNFERSIIGLLPFAAMTAGMNREIATLFFGPDYGDAGPILAVLIFAALGMVMLSMCTSMLVAADRPGLTWVLLLPIVPLAFLGHLVFIPPLGARGAVAVSAVVTGLATLGGMIAAARVCGVKPPMNTTFRSAAIGMAVYLLCRSIDVTSLGIAEEHALLIKLLVSFKLLTVSLGIPGAFILMGEFSRSERRFILSLFSARFRDA